MLRTLALSAALGPLLGCASEPPDPFLRACERGPEAGEDLARTVQALLEVAGSDDCAAAHAALQQVTHLDLKNRPDRLTTLAPMAPFTQVEVIELGDNRITNLSPLSGFSSLRELHLDVNGVIDVSPLVGLSSLEVLWLDRNPVADVAALSGLSKLRRLDLAHTGVTDLSPLSGLNALEALTVGGTKVTDLSPLARLSALRELGIRGTRVSSLGPLSGLANLTVLDARGLGVTDIAPLSGLTGLLAVDLGDNGLDDLAAAAGWSGLEELALDGNPLEPDDCAPLSGVAAEACARATAAPPGAHRAFVSSCRMGSEAPIATRVTVEALLDAAGTRDCAAAAEALASRTAIDLTGHVVPDLRPLQAFPALETLTVDPDVVDPETCPTGPGVTPPVAAVCEPLHAERLAAMEMPEAFRAACQGGGAAQRTYAALRKAVNGRDCADTWRRLHPRAHLSLVDQGLTDLTPLSGLTHLRRLYLDYNDLTDLSPLSSLTRLQVLWLDDNALSDLSVVESMPSLLWLQAGDNPVSDLTPLAGRVHLRRLWLGGDQIRDVSPLAGLTRLHKLHLAVNEIADVSPLSGLTEVETLYLAHNRVTDATPLAALPHLSLLSAGLDEEEDALQADRWFLAGNPIDPARCPTEAPASFKLRRFCAGL